MAGRPTDLTPETQAAYLDALRRTYYIDTAADLAGIHRQSVYHWIKRGRREPGSIYAAFSDAVKKVMAETESKHVQHIEVEPQWQARAWLLERRHPERWGSQRRELAELKKAVIALEGKLGGDTAGTTEAASSPPASPATPEADSA